MNNHALVTLSCLLFAAGCGGGSTVEPSDPSDAIDVPATTPPDASDEGDLIGAPGDTSCYVERVGTQSGCWPSADDACTEVCSAACTCTEATSKNSCEC